MSASNNSNNSNQQTFADSGANARPPWESRFRRFLDNQLEEGERMWNSIQNGPYQRPMVPNPDSPVEQILEPLFKMTEGNKKKYIADVRVMNYFLQAILNDIYNSVDACKTAQEMWEQIKRLMYRSDITTHVRHLRLMDEFDKFAAKEGESLDSVYERLTTLNGANMLPWFVAVSYDVLYDSLVQFEPHVLASRAKKAAKNHDPLALIAYSNASSSHPNANSSYSPQSYYVTHPPYVVDYDDEYQGELQGDSQEDKLTTTMIKANVQCYNCNEKGHYARDCQKPKVRDANYFREQMLLAMKDEARSHLSNEENDFMVDTAYGEESLDELTTSVMLMARLQPADGNTDTILSYDETTISQVNDSSKAHEQVSYGKRKTIIQTTNNDQIDSTIIFYDPYVANISAENPKRLNNELKKQKDLLQQELKTFKDRVKTFESQTVQSSKYKETCDDLEPKKVYQERENRYFEDIVDLEEKLSSHDRIVYKIGQSIQTIHMLAKKPNNVYDHFLKAGLGYQNPERLKKAIAAQPKLYDGDLLHCDKLIIDSPNSEGTLEDAKESRIKMRNKMNLKDIKEELIEDVQEMLNIFESMEQKHKKEVDELIQCVDKNTYAYGDVRAKNQDLLMTISELKSKLRTIEKEKNVNTKFDSSNTLGKHVCVTSFNKNIADKAMHVSNTKFNSDRSKQVTSQSTPKPEQCQKHNANVITRGMYKINKQDTKTPDYKANTNVSNLTSVGSSHSVRRSTSKDNKSKNSILKNTKSSSTYVWKTLNSDCLDSNKCDTKTLNVYQTNACISNSKTVKACVNVVNDGSNIVCISCVNDVFLNSYEKCVARHALSRKSSVKRALFTSPLAAQSKNLGATFVVTKSRLSVAKTPTATSKVIQLILWIVDSGFLKHMTGNLQLLRNFIKKFMGTVRFGNDHFAAITGYSDYVQGNLTICHVYYIEGLGHNLFSVGQFCDGDLEVAFHSKMCYVWNLEGDDLLTGSRDSNLYTISISEMAASSPVCLMSNATSTKSWLILDLDVKILSELGSLGHNLFSARQFCDEDLEVAFCSNTCYVWNLKGDDLLTGSRDSNLYTISISEMAASSPVSCEQGKSKKASLPPKLVLSIESKLELLHMDLCGPMRVASINGKKYILVIVDDYSRYTWVYFLRTKDEAPDMIIDFVNQVQRNLKAQILTIRIDNGTEFKKEKLRSFYAKLGIVYKTSIARTPQQNGVVKRRNHTLIETSSQKVSDDSAANTTNNDHTSSSSSIVIDQDDAPQIVSSLDKQVATASNSPVINEVADEFIQEDVADFDGNMFHDAP
ncbi:integrase, catalytic region, zinc finger, CCHC-type containing protein [Tanacetum coccineum]|uniref:Integrase, catalytic region, zinc finger, CCHC-type containing protein n=1 Tax=Tanacetum coccineum TaxID=301880 RepID=A0ABQ5J656_9ASTR